MMLLGFSIVLIINRVFPEVCTHFYKLIFNSLFLRSADEVSRVEISSRDFCFSFLKITSLEADVFNLSLLNNDASLVDLGNQGYPIIKSSSRRNRYTMSYSAMVFAAALNSSNRIGWMVN